MKKLLTEKVNTQEFIVQFDSKIRKILSSNEAYKEDNNKIRLNIIGCAEAILLSDPTIPILNKFEIVNSVKDLASLDRSLIEYEIIRLQQSVEGPFDGFNFTSTVPGGQYYKWVEKIILKGIKAIISIPSRFEASSKLEDAIDILWRFRTEDFPSVFFNLCIYHKFKSILPEHERDINSIDSKWHLNNLSNSIVNSFKEKEKIELVEGKDYKILSGSFNHEHSTWVADPRNKNTFAAILYTHKAARLFGKNSDWCTSLNYSKFFNLYTQDGSNLYVYSHHNDVIKEPLLVQLHTPSDQNMDYKDEGIPFALSNPSAKIVYDYIMDGDAPTIDKFYLILKYIRPTDTLKLTLNNLALKLVSENISIITEQIEIIMNDVKTSIFSTIAQINMTLDIASKVRVENIPELEQDIFGSTQSIDRSYFRHIATNFFNNGNKQFNFIMNSYITKSLIAFSKFTSTNLSNNVEYTVDILPLITDNTRLSKILQQLFPEIFSQIISEYDKMIKTNLGSN